LDRERSFTIAAGRDVPLGVDHDQAEAFGIDPRQLGNIGRDLAPIRPLPHLVGYFSYDKVKVGHGVARLISIRGFAGHCEGVLVE
jgi:hypothetical protein